MSPLGTWENHSLWPQIFRCPWELGHPCPINFQVRLHVQMEVFETHLKLESRCIKPPPHFLTSVTLCLSDRSQSHRPPVPARPEAAQHKQSGLTMDILNQSFCTKLPEWVHLHMKLGERWASATSSFDWCLRCRCLTWGPKQSSLQKHYTVRSQGNHYYLRLSWAIRCFVLLHVNIFKTMTAWDWPHMSHASPANMLMG